MTDNGKERIGDYELVSLIGDGAQGRVYKAQYQGDDVSKVAKDEIVAIKVIRITGDDDKLRTKFQAQADILRRLSHTNIVRYRDSFAWHAGEWDEAQCLVMEFLEGETLTERLKKASTGLAWTQVETVFEQCLAGLIHARERGITHRDIKPSNIFITKDGQTKLIDFDIARRDDSGQMSTAGWKGTFDYMAPDFISTNGFRGDEISDIFSLGVCFYQALTGALPFEPLGETAHIGYLNRWRNNASPTPSFRPGVFRVLSNAKALVAKSLAARREDRYPTFVAMLEEFRNIRYRRVKHKNKDEYELLAVLGRGGFGEVFKARRMSDGMLVAVKYLFSEKQSERFIKEAKILQQYPHPNLVKYVDFMVLEGTAGEKQFFLVMEFLEGMPGWTLRHRLKNESKLEASEAVAVFSAYLSSLQFLHGSARPIIHRDIKPGNLYAPMGQPDKSKIFDLGVARDVSGTVTVGGIPGTLDYMAPEFAEAGGDRGSPSSDLYALGLCLYEALAGKPVFDRLPSDLNSAWVAFQDRIRKPPAIAFDAEAFVQYPRIKQVILKALAEKPEARYHSAADMRVALEDALKPEKANAAHDDAFDAGEMTIATFTGGSGAAAEAGATLGTRPLDMAGGTLSGAVNLIAAGKQEAERRKQRKLMMIAGGAAAALLVFGLGGIWLGTSFGGRKNGAAQQVRQPDAQPNRKPAEVSGPANPVTSKPAQPEAVKPVQTAVEAAQKEPEKPVLVPPERDPVYLGLKSEIPEKIERDDDWSAAEAAAAKLTAQEKQAWPDVDDAEKARRLAALRATLADRASAYVAKVRDAALAAYAAGKDGKEDGERLTQMAKNAPLLKALVGAPLDEAGKRVTAAENKAAEAKAAQAAADLRAKAVADAAKRLDELNTRIQKGALTGCADGVALLGGFTLDQLSDADLKTKWQSVRGAYVKLVEQTLAQKEPLEQRAQRLKSAEEVLVHPSAGTLFASEIAALRKALDQQKAVCVLRLVNRSGNAVQVSGRELKEKVSLADGATKELELPVSGETLAASLLVDGGSRFRPRSEAVSLPHAGGVEWAIGALVAESAKPVEPATPPVVKQQPVTPPPVAMAVQPTNRASANPPSVPAAAGGAAFDITVSPKNAVAAVDGKAVTAGTVMVVTPNENHKVTVECAGYKPVQQYYKAKPGETRKIDILLEKVQKKSMFGL